jgi:hypothetical protein
MFLEIISVLFVFFNLTLAMILYKNLFKPFDYTIDLPERNDNRAS